MAIKGRFTVGRRNISSSTKVKHPYEIGYTQSVKRQMEQVEKNFNALVAHLSGPNLEEAVEAGAMVIFNESQRLVPVKTGRLKKSGYVIVRRTSAGASVEIGYGRGGNPHYTAKVHEDLEAPHTPPTQAKFLEAAVDTKLREAFKEIGDRLRIA